jgi:hypothetical protein
MEINMSDYNEIMERNTKTNLNLEEKTVTLYLKEKIVCFQFTDVDIFNDDESNLMKKIVHGYKNTTKSLTGNYYIVLTENEKNIDSNNNLK